MSKFQDLISKISKEDLKAITDIGKSLIKSGLQYKGEITHSALSDSLKPKTKNKESDIKR